MISFRLQRTVKLGLKSLWLHKLRSGLTALGIVFGVASVVAMLAIGEGASQEAQEQIQKLGSQNVIISSVKPPSGTAASSSGNSMVEYGITYEDLERIETTIPDVDVVVPVREVRQDAYQGSRKTDATVVGTVPWFVQIRKIPVLDGRFLSSSDMTDKKSLCVINRLVARDLFPYDNPLEKSVKIGPDYYKVVGMVDDSSLTTGEGKTSKRIFIPLTTARARFGDTTMKFSGSSREFEKVLLHQATVMVKTVKVKNEDLVLETANAIRVLMKRFHKKQDFEITVPLELLNQAKKTKRIFSIVLGSIAAISLLVGGIGIMNIMLASVTERTREIGVRRALGAKKRDIIMQFLTETVLLSGFGGMLGILLGVLMPEAVRYFASMKTVVTLWSLVLSFGISAAVGIIFGIYPAQRAANLDPIEALRHE